MNRTLGRTMEAFVALTTWVTLGALAVPGDAQDASALYKSKCAACHGADGKGETTIGKANKMRSLSSEDVQTQSDADLSAIITNGKNKMPAYAKGLKPEQVKDLVAYIRLLAKK